MELKDCLAENKYPITTRYDDPRYMERQAHECFKEGCQAQLNSPKLAQYIQARVAEAVKAKLKEGIDTATVVHRGINGDYRLLTIAISEEEYQALSATEEK